MKISGLSRTALQRELQSAKTNGQFRADRDRSLRPPPNVRCRQLPTVASATLTDSSQP